jgi:hypothetical protein
VLNATTQGADHVRSRPNRRHLAFPDGALTFQAKLGVAAHAAIADSLRDAERTGGRPRVSDASISRLIAKHGLNHDRRRAVLLLRSFVRAYHEDYGLSSEWRLQSAERPLTEGRIDLLFRRRDGAILGDELKTRHGLDGRIEPSDREQVSRYVGSLRAEFPSSFRGVRLILLGPPSHAHLIRNLGDLAALDQCRRPN